MLLRTLANEDTNKRSLQCLLIKGVECTLKCFFIRMENGSYESQRAIISSIYCKLADVFSLENVTLSPSSSSSSSPSSSSSSSSCMLRLFDPYLFGESSVWRFFVILSFIYIGFVTGSKVFRCTPLVLLLGTVNSLRVTFRKLYLNT